MSAPAIRRRVALRVLASGGATIGAAIGLVACGHRVDHGAPAGTNSDPDPLAPDLAGGVVEGCGVRVAARRVLESDGSSRPLVERGTFWISGATRDAIILARDAGGMFAMSGACTHARCALVPKGTQPDQYWYCHCHGGRFDYVGTGTTHVAPDPLPHYRITACGEDWYVDLSQPVSADERLPIADDDAPDGGAG